LVPYLLVLYSVSFYYKAILYSFVNLLRKIIDELKRIIKSVNLESAIKRILPKIHTVKKTLNLFYA